MILIIPIPCSATFIDVAVSGLPEPRSDHAIVMARFAQDTLMTVQHMVRQLELSLGPDTGELGVRIGIHSGVVTAGVLRGDRARFQLFGDTVNTTARMETMGQKNRIHLSQDTADLLVAAGKGHWLQPREDMITPKGKSPMQTYWLVSVSNAVDGKSVNVSDESPECIPVSLWGNAEVAEQKAERLVDWQVDVFSRLLKQVMACRNALERCSDVPQSNSSDTSLLWDSAPGQTCLDEVKEIITLPEFNARRARLQQDAETVDLGENVRKQLREYISTIAYMYRANGFHNWEHACHVTMSVTKLLSRIVAPSDFEWEATDEDGKGEEDKMKRKVASTLHDHTYGITSDPLTQFALVFSAMIHDVDHTGVPNSTLIDENKALAKMYHSKSVAEQNSIELAWRLLEEPRFQDFRTCIYSTKADFDRFRQLVVQAVLATDIADKELKILRNARWDRAFDETHREEDIRDTVNRKATIVIEHLIQASDVAHTMQHWHVYRKWNENFFRECYKAYKDGRASTDPSINWYKAEIGFFDFYIIPLAKKLKKCGVFGVASDEYLNYALKNRKEWDERGKEVVAEMVNAISTGDDGQGLNSNNTDVVSDLNTEVFHDDDEI